MGYLDNTSTTVDAILTKKGRELLARGGDEFKITKFALGDDEVDYGLYDVTHPNGTNSYGSAIENLPMLEAFPDENQIMRYKLVTLPKGTSKMPILELPIPSTGLTFTSAGQKSAISPDTKNGSDAQLGYTVILNNSDAVLEMLQRFNEDLSDLQKAIRKKDGDKLHSFFSRTRLIRKKIIEAGQI